MKRDGAVRFRHMIEAAETLARFIDQRRREDLDADTMLAFALTRAIEIFGEAASRISLELRAATPQVPWPAIIGMRNRLIHAYFDMDHDILWNGNPGNPGVAAGARLSPVGGLTRETPSCPAPCRRR